MVDILIILIIVLVYLRLNRLIKKVLDDTMYNYRVLKASYEGKDYVVSDLRKRLTALENFLCIRFIEKQTIPPKYEKKGVKK